MSDTEAESTTEQQSESAAPEPLPEGFACLRCSYDLSNSQLWACPECGTQFKEEDVVTQRFRVRVKKSVWSSLSLWLTMLTCQVGASIALCLTGRYAWSVGAFILAVASLLAFVGFGVGAILSMTTPEGTRREHLWAWLRAQWSMQKPWLLVVVGSVILLPASYLVRAIGNEWFERGLLGSHWLAVILWFALTVRFANDWAKSFRETAQSLSLEPCAGRTAMVVVGWMIYGFAMIAGFQGGVLAILWSRAILANL